METVFKKETCQIQQKFGRVIITKYVYEGWSTGSCGICQVYFCHPPVSVFFLLSRHTHPLLISLSLSLSTHTHTHTSTHTHTQTHTHTHTHTDTHTHVHICTTLSISPPSIKILPPIILGGKYTQPCVSWRSGCWARSFAYYLVPCACLLHSGRSLHPILYMRAPGYP